MELCDNLASRPLADLALISRDAFTVDVVPEATAGEMANRYPRALVPTRRFLMAFPRVGSACPAKAFRGRSPSAVWTLRVHRCVARPGLRNPIGRHLLEIPRQPQLR